MFETTNINQCPRCLRSAFSFIITQTAQGHVSRCTDCYNRETSTVSDRDALLAVARAAKVMIDRLPNNVTADGVYTTVEVEHALRALPDSIKAEIEKRGT